MASLAALFEKNILGRLWSLALYSNIDTKHTALRYFFVEEHVQERMITSHYVKEGSCIKHKANRL